MSDRLLAIAERLHIPTDASAGPLGASGLELWARWPRNSLLLAHEVLERVCALEPEAKVEWHRAEHGWHAQLGEWSFSGDFEETVTELAQKIVRQRRFVRPS